MSRSLYVMLWKLRLAARLALGLGLLVPQAALGAGAGSFSPTGSMGTPRYALVAGPLDNGQVLVAGGYHDNDGGDHYLASAEVFDPATSSFSSAGIGAMGAARRGAAAAPLPDGRVLVAGGDDGTTPLASAEVFNPATNAFTPVGDMGIARVRAAAAPLPDGRVLVAGGNDGTTRLSSAEVFNPATNAFTPVADMGTDRARAAAAPLPDGRALVAGGTNGAPLASAEVFNPATNSFSSVGIGAMGTARQAPAAAPLPDGSVLVAGGVHVEGPGGYLASAEVFDPATNSFSSAGIGAMGTVRTGAAAAPLPDGRVLVAGGFDGSTRLSSAEIFAETNTGGSATNTGGSGTPSDAKPASAFSISVEGSKLIVSVQASGKVSVVDSASPLRASSAKRKHMLLLKPSSASGDPPTISVPLRLAKHAKLKLRHKGTVEVRPRITFLPQGGLANTQTAELKIKAQGKKQ